MRDALERLKAAVEMVRRRWTFDRNDCLKAIDAALATAPEGGVPT
jgi:hypothetical protein